jgi:hypothetical protein
MVAQVALGFLYAFTQKILFHGLYDRTTGGDAWSFLTHSPCRATTLPSLQSLSLGPFTDIAPGNRARDAERNDAISFGVSGPEFFKKSENFVPVHPLPSGIC